MVPAPLRCVSEAFPLIVRDVVPDQVERDDGHTSCLNDPVRPPGMVDEYEPLPDLRQRLTRQVLNRQRGRRRLLTAQHRGEQPVT
jgi:hypothetical protein